MTTQPRDPLVALRAALQMAAGQVSMATIMGKSMQYDPIDAVLRARVLPLVEAAEAMTCPGVNRQDRKDHDELRVAIAALTAEPGKERT